jgi:hypothetical protein
MELKDIKILGSIIPRVLNIVTKHDLKDREFDFVYGQEEYTKDFKKLKNYGEKTNRYRVKC